MNSIYLLIKLKSNTTIEFNYNKKNIVIRIERHSFFPPCETLVEVYCKFGLSY
jgi:hypothetical protein